MNQLDINQVVVSFVERSISKIIESIYKGAGSAYDALKLEDQNKKSM